MQTIEEAVQYLKGHYFWCHEKETQIEPDGGLAAFLKKSVCKTDHIVCIPQYKKKDRLYKAPAIIQKRKYIYKYIDYEGYCIYRLIIEELQREGQLIPTKHATTTKWRQIEVVYSYCSDSYESDWADTWQHCLFMMYIIPQDQQILYYLFGTHYSKTLMILPRDITCSIVQIMHKLTL